jgi:polar amino acid transport system substrate-binding protein
MQPSRVFEKITTNCKVVLVVSLLPVIAILLTLHSKAQDTTVPKFRHIDPGIRAIQALPKLTMRLLVSADYAPFEFQGSDGLVKGISVDLARAACANLHVTCELVVKPFPELVPALERAEGDLIITPLHLTASALLKLAATRPYYVSSARFVVKTDSRIEKPDRRSFAGLRIGAIRNSAQAAFLKSNFVKFTLQDYDTDADLFAAVQNSDINAAFTDGLHAAFWLKGETAKACCRTLGGPFMDPTTFSHGASFATSKDRQGLVDAFDQALDSLETSGATAEIFTRYVPASLW